MEKIRSLSSCRNRCIHDFPLICLASDSWAGVLSVHDVVVTQRFRGSLPLPSEERTS